jgi:dolichol-phosphate mannosyltransferase
MKTLISLPTYNESENIERLVEKILATVVDLHVLIIDDNSPDGTGQIADKLSQKYPGRVIVKHRAGKLGLGSAIMEGFKYAMLNNYTFVVNMDCDFSHDPSELPSVLKAAENADLVIASRHVKGGSVVGWNTKRKILHWGAQQYTNFVLGRYVTDHTNSYRAYRVKMLEKLPLQRLLGAGAGFVWHTLLTNVAHKRGYKIAEVPSIFVDRQVGRSKMSQKEMLGGLVAILKMRLFGRSLFC